MMNTFILVRHGETENNRAKRLSGWIDTPLTENGLVPTDRVISKLAGTRIDRMYSSDMGRAFITAYYISRGIGYTGEIVTQSGLREVSYGDAGNMFSKDAYKLYPELDRITDFSPPNGESLDQMQQRVLRTVAEIDQFNTDKTILLVAHSGVMAALEAAHLGRDFGQQNISEAYDHDVICQFTVTNEQIATFEKT